MTLSARLICHIIHRLDFGGLENGLVNLINHMPPEEFRHVILSLKPPTEFQQRLRNPAAEVICLDKKEGKDLSAYGRAWRLLRLLHPDIVHTRNIPALDMLVPAAMAGVRCLVHSEHGLDMHELDGRHRKYNLLRRLSRPLVSRYVAVSQDLAHWMAQDIGIAKDKIALIYNGVDTGRFHPGAENPEIVPYDLASGGKFIIGTVGRFEPIKDQLALCHAFIHLLETLPELRQRLRLVLVGDGGQRHEIRRLLSERGVADLAWLPGLRNDMPEIYRHFSVFVLPSRREGISNTLLEAMASGLPVIATRVGGNPELVDEHHSGLLVPADAPQELAAALLRYIDDSGLLVAHGLAARERAVTRFSLATMVSAYMNMYRSL